MSAVVVRNVTKTFNAGTPGQVDALVDINLDVASGEFVSLIGPSGCGKSTLLRLIANLTEPTSGTIEVNGKPADQARVDQDYGMAFQQAGLFDWRTVVRNVELPLELKGWDRTRRRSRAMEMLELVKLDEFAGHRPWQLSGGMQQRVAIARALAAAPQLLLMDEPFGALDEMTREHMQSELLRISAEAGTSVVFVTHSIPEAVFLADRVVVMSPRPGRITEIVAVELGDVRNTDTREDPLFFKKITEVREALRGIGAMTEDELLIEGIVAERYDEYSSRSRRGLAARRLRYRLPSRLGDRRGGVRLEGVLPAGAIGDLGVVRREHRQRPRGSDRFGSQRLGRPARRDDPRSCDELPADALPAAQRHGQPVGRSAQCDPDHRPRVGVQQPVRQHLRGATPVDGHARRVLRRARQRGQGSSPGRADAPRAASLLCRLALRRAAQGPRSERRSVPVHGAEDRRPARRDHRLRRRVLRWAAERPGFPDHRQRQRLRVPRCGPT